MSASVCYSKISGCILQRFSCHHRSAFYRCYRQSVKDVISILPNKTGVPVNIRGWLRNVRKQKRVLFCNLNDGSCYENLQIVADPSICQSELSPGVSVEVTGTLVPSVGKGQEVELQADSLTVLGPCDNEFYPFKPRTEYTQDFLRNYPHLRCRTLHHQNLLRIRDSATMAVHKFLQDNGFLFVHTPIITSSDCEGAGEMFHIKTNEELKSLNSEKPQQFFDRPSYLTVSGQLHLEIITGAFLRAYSFGPTFRAEKSPGRYHLAEFYMIEAEIAFTKSLDCVIQVMEDLVKSVTTSVFDKHESAIQDLWKQSNVEHISSIADRLTKNKYIRMTYTDAVNVLKQNSEKLSSIPNWGCDLSKEYEQFLVRYCDNVPVFVTDFPADLKPFYARTNSDEKTVSAVDLLVPEVGELFGGSLREERLQPLQDKLESLGLMKNYQWYLDLRQFGSVPHGGFGMGFERYLQCLLGIYNIKDAVPFPRWVGHCQL
ncbi:probable asparagine--tRNA ligase, mitochondrial isoform X1 [Dreissena polymorpha]|uniref:probable asparagine--tRNA ligase, mitochondrial isoform X1 n=1 Tax=Dreissena polymorpha TaxID=45954 RepID=UPI0022644AE8|nr:probable asparagine--tRNA ligase, mitochondrial isoform X1 [Dreissena polymorpha]